MGGGEAGIQEFAEQSRCRSCPGPGLSTATEYEENLDVKEKSKHRENKYLDSGQKI